MTQERLQFMAGAIEGFYGPPWSREERHELFSWMSAWGLNTYLYAPKDDLHHRTLWREPYSGAAAEDLRELVRACREGGIDFIYGLGPGLDIRYSAEADLDRLRARFEQMLALGCEWFALLFDDIPDRLPPEDIERWASPASAQAYVANTILGWLRERTRSGRLFFCPTPYCGRMADAGLGGPDYLPALGRELHPEIDIFWTGPDIVSREITAAHVRSVGGVLRRKPVLWDNLHANDYDGRRFFCGPYSGRTPDVRAEAAGILSNPNTEFPLNFVPLRTLADFARSGTAWDPRDAYTAAMREWLPAFDSVGRTLTFDELVLLGDCYYLPYEDGAGADAFFRGARALLERPPGEWGSDALQVRAEAARLRDLCVKLTELRLRPLFHALSRRIWDLREEVDLLDRYVAMKSEDPAARARSDFHLPGTFRGGFVARLQRLLMMKPDGTFVVADGPGDGRPLDVHPGGPGEAER